jgi:cellulose synthase/poly-beta-1,6-N-acetylglucosamine synthase-like glycosyltransferase
VTPLFLIALLLGAGLLGLALRIEAQRRAAPPLPSAAPSGPRAAVTVLLPVRDEEQNVLPCLDGLLTQTAEPLVRVIDDGSTDATAALVTARAAAEPRLTVLQAGPLADGWPGKVHALWVGSHGAGTPWLLLTDADTRHAPALLARALTAADAAEERRFDAVSVTGLQEARGLGENLLVPPVFALLDAVLGDWGAAADGSGPAVANGQFLLVRREAWEAAGGFASVRTAPIDDVAMARRLREHGGRTGFFRAPDLLRVRMYHGWTEACRGWRRNLGALFSDAPAAAAGAFLALLLPPLALLGALLAGRSVEAALLWSAGAAASSLLRAGSGHRAAWGLLYPCDALAVAAVLALGIADRRRGRPVRWKGRAISS